MKTITQKPRHNLEDPNAPEKQLVGAATKCAHAATQLVAVARITAPTIHDPACQQQLADAMKDVSVAIKGMLPLGANYLNAFIYTTSFIYTSILNQLKV